MSRMELPSRPHENCYWVLPGVLMAGEYPYATRLSSPLANLEAIVGAGARHIVDLTHDRGRLPGYGGVLSAISRADGPRVGYERFAIVDRAVPESQELTNRVLDRIDELVASNRVPYVH